MRDRAQVEVLIVTLCLAERAAAIRRAVDTTLTQAGVRASLIIVVNGRRYDAGLFEALRRLPRVRVIYQQEASIFRARRCAREHVTAPFFGFLDDDDHLLPGALRARVDALRVDPAADAVVANGYLADGTGEVPMLDDIAAIRRDPLQNLLRANWLATASTLFRTGSIPPDFFATDIRSIDMTYVAFRLALEKKVVFLDTPTYRKTYSSDSISLSEEWELHAPATLRKLLAFDLPAPVRRGVRRKYAGAAHDASDIYRRRGQRRLAWRYHLASLAEPRGMRAYALYTRHLLVPLPRGERRVPAAVGRPQ